jgi:hypothetical protein
MKSNRAATKADAPSAKTEFWRLYDDLATKRNWILSPTTMSQYIKTDHILPIKKDERVNYFNPDVDPFAGVDASVFDQLNQDTKKTQKKPAKSLLYNPYLPENQSKNKPIDSIEYKKEQKSWANPTQEQHHKTIVVLPSGGKKEEAIHLEEAVDLNLKQPSESSEETLPSSFQVDSPHENTTTSDETLTTIDRNEAQQNIKYDGMTQSLGNNVSNGDTEDGSNASKEQAAVITSSSNKHFAKTLQ